MPVGVTRDHLDLGTTLRGWAAGLGGPAALRDVENEAAAGFAKTWQGVVERETCHCQHQREWRHFYLAELLSRESYTVIVSG